MPKLAKRGPRPRRVPERTCCACRQKLAKRALVRVVRGLDLSVRIDSTGKAPGRGAYVHDRPSCWNQALRQHSLERALKVALTDEDAALLRARAAEALDDSDSAD